MRPGFIMCLWSDEGGIEIISIFKISNYNLKLITMFSKSMSQYRLSNNELLLLNNLYEIFSKNGFYIDKWPEIYYCDYNIAKHNFEILEEEYPENNYIFNPDFLGIYSYNYSKEGIIILFRDRILNASGTFQTKNKRFNNLDEIITLLKTKVLIHEIGHWLTHSCAIINKDEILFQYGTLPKVIKESLAQLTVIWSFYKRKSEFEYKLESFARIFMPKQPKPYYEFSKIHHIYSPEIILKRYLGIASQMTHLNEDSLFKLLIKNETDLRAIEIDVLNGKRI
jgi:hypothetical protein